jgi:hypothetical protein
MVLLKVFKLSIAILFDRIERLILFGILLSVQLVLILYAVEIAQI